MNTQEFNVKSIVVGCNYHTKWQTHRNMRFVLAEVKDSKARLKTRNTNKEFWTDVSDLIFIMTNHNINKARRLLKTHHQPITKPAPPIK